MGCHMQARAWHVPGELCRHAMPGPVPERACRALGMACLCLHRAVPEPCRVRLDCHPSHRADPDIGHVLPTNYLVDLLNKPLDRLRVQFICSILDTYEMYALGSEVFRNSSFILKYLREVRRSSSENSVKYFYLFFPKF